VLGQQSIWANDRFGYGGWLIGVGRQSIKVGSTVDRSRARPTVERGKANKLDGSDKRLRQIVRKAELGRGDGTS